MKIIVTSDSHGDVEILKKIALENSDASIFIDAGDSCKRKEEIAPFETVKGNCDLYIKNNYRIYQASSVGIYTTHGHGLFFTNKTLAKLAKDFGCKIAIHGHTHVPEITEIDGIKILCPGSVSIPRSQVGKTYAVINIVDENDIDIKIVKI